MTAPGTLAMFLACAAFVTLGAPASGQQRSRQDTAAKRDTQHQAATAPATLLARADSAFDAEDRDRARELYAAALARDSTLSRAVYRLGQLATSSGTQIAWFRRYERLQPGDPWGFMAEGDALSRHGRFDEALAAYTHAASIAPDERDVAIGRARVLTRAGRSADAMTVLEGWTRQHPGDFEGWDLLGRAALRSGRPRAAEQAFARAAAGDGVRGADARRDYARALAAPALEPIIGYQRDSDGNRATRTGGSADVMVADGTRLGVGAEHLTIGDGVLSSTGTHAFARLTSRLSPGARLDVQGGAVRLGAPSDPALEWTTPQVDARLRLRAPRNGASLEVRAQRLALGTAPMLVEHRVARTEGRVTLELPAGWFRLRGTGRAGQMSATGESSNGRFGVDGALVVPMGGQVQLSGQYRVMGFQRASTAGYFAPRRAETIEGGVYVETPGDSPLSLAADLGGGAQRVAVQGADVGRWTRALRAWSYAALALAPGRSLYAELEAYDAPFAPEGVATSGTWRFVSLSVGLRWSLR